VLAKPGFWNEDILEEKWVKEATLSDQVWQFLDIYIYILLNCLATRKAKTKLLCKKWLDMNSVVAYGRVIYYSNTEKVIEMV
jgi:hypothetical protein